LRSDERGFTLAESIIAITVIFASLVSLAYAATASLHYQDIARQRQGADGVASKVMEEIRGLAYDKVTSGLLATDLAGDANIVTGCAGDVAGVYRFLSCAHGTEPGSGEKLVISPGLTTTVPLVPHRSGTAPNTNPVLNNITYSWSTYVTQDDSISNPSYRVTVVVSWTGGGSSSSKLVRIQSLFWSPIGCRGTSTHPFSAPCQPFFLGNATVPNGDVSVTGTLQGTPFTSLEILLMGVSTSVQQEQIASGDASTHSVQGTITDSTITSAGGASGSVHVDGDPNTGSGPYKRVRCGTEITCAGGTLTSPSAGGSNQVTLNVPATTYGESDSAITANAANVCPPTSVQATGESDGLPCAGAAVQQSTAMVAVFHLGGTAPVLGDANMARVGATGSNLGWAFADRVANPAPVTAGCTPAAGTNGCVAVSAGRTYGNIRLGGLPSNMSQPISSGNCTVAGDFYFLNVNSYSDSAKAATGEGTPLATASAPSGTLYYWDQASSSCKSIALNSASINGLNASYSTTQNVGGTNVTATIATVPAQTSAATVSATSTPATSSNPQPTRTDESAQVVAPVLTVHYTIVTPTQTLVDVTEAINLGTLTLDSTYAPPPAAGS
jgi:type II secretory pathway pseudopilin PulG